MLPRLLKFPRYGAAAAALLIFALPLSALPVMDDDDDDPDPDEHAVKHLVPHPLGFEQNHGQAGPNVRFLARGKGYRLFLTSDQCMVAVRPGKGGRKNDSVALRLVGADMNASPAAESQQPGKVNYFIGKDTANWKKDVPLFGRVRYSQIYPGIDLLYYGDDSGTLEHDFIVAPGADLSRIRLKADDARRLRLDVNGDLVIQTSTGEARLLKPIAYQEVGGKRVPINAGFRIRGPDTITFHVAGYDRSRVLVIDPILVFSTYFGGGDGSTIRDMKADANGNVYIVGDTVSINLPVLNAYQSTSHANYYAEAFVTRLNAGGQLVYSTYLGGSNKEEGDGIAVDTSGNAYIVGVTGSSDFPTVVGSYHTTQLGGDDYFVSKLNSSGGLVYSTYIGSTTTEFGQLTRFQRPSIAVHTDGTAYIAGNTFGSDFPVVNGQAKNAGIANPGGSVAARLSADGASLIYSTYLPNQQIVEIAGMALDLSGNSYLAGIAPGNADTPPTATGGAYRQSSQGYDDGFVIKMSPTGSVAYATYLGGSGSDAAFGIAADTNGNAYVTGFTGSTNWPVKNALQGACHGTPITSNVSLCWDAFVTKLNAAGSDTVYSTYLGGTGNDPSGSNPGGVDYGFSIVADANGKAYISGVTQTPDFPTASPYQAACAPDSMKGGCSNDGFVTILTAAGALEFSTYFGGSGYDSADVIALDGNGNLYVAGNTQSTNLPRLNALQSSFPGGSGSNVGFVAKFSTAAATPGLNPSVPSLTFTGQVVNTTSSSQAVTLTGNGNTSVNISGISVSGDYSQTNNCPSVLALGATCTVNVTFTPTATGTRTGSLNVSDNAGGHSVSLSGTGLATPSISFNPSSLGFASLAAGQISPTQTVTITNTGATSVTFTSIVPSGPFTVTAQTCTAVPVNQNATCTVTVDFRPTTGGPASGSVTINSNASSAPHIVALSGNGLAAAISLLPGSLAFPDTLSGQISDPQRILVTNTGNLNLTISAVNLNNNNPAEYTLSTTCVATVVPGGTCFIDVLFTPKAIGTFNTATITFSSNTNGPTITLSGKGTGPTLTFNPTSLTFASAQSPQTVGVDSAPQSFTATASGGFPIHLNQVSVGSSDFRITHDCPQLLAAGAFCTVNVIYRPGSGGVRNSSVTFATDAAVPNPNLTVPISGTAQSGGVTANPKTITFPATAINQNPSPIGSTLITNSTGATITIAGFPNNFTITGPDASSFFRNFTGCENNNAAFPHGLSCTLEIGFAPTTPGAKTATVNMSYTGATGSPLTINLVGSVGSAPNVSLFPAVTPSVPYMFFTNPVTNVGATSASQAVTLKNTGGATLNISGIATSQDFLQTNNCAVTLASGVSCTINVSFSPIATSTRYGSLTVTDDAAGSPHVLLMLGTAGNRTPVVTSLSPDSASQGRPLLLLTVRGQYFLPGAIVNFHNGDRFTTFQDVNTLVAVIPASEFATNDTVQVTVKNPTPGGGAGNNVAFTIMANSSPVGALESAVNQADNTTTIGQYGDLAAAGWAADPEDGSPVSRVQIRIVPPGITDISGLYFLDSTHNVVRFIDSLGNISTVAGNGTAGFSGDGGPATGASLNFSAIGLSGGLAMDSSGNLYISDSNNCCVRKVDSSTHVITTVAGAGCSATGVDGGSATLANLPAPLGLAVATNGDIYVASGQRIRKVSGGIISTVAGLVTTSCTPGTNLNEGGAATAANLCNPADVAVAANGDFYIADSSNNRVRKVSSNVITTVVGDGSTTFTDNVAPTSAGTGLNNPVKVSIDANGTLYIADLSHGRVRKVDFGANKITTVAGNGGSAFSGDNGSATSASFGGFFYSAIDQDGNIYVSDRNVHRLRRVDAQSGSIATIAGNGTAGYSGDGGPALTALLDKPLGMVALGKTVSPNIITLDGTLGGARADIAAAQSRPDYASSGFTANLNIGLLPIGNYEAQAVAYDSAGAGKLLSGTVPINVIAGQYGILSLSGGSLDFGNQLVGGFTAPQIITVTNFGNASMSLTVGVTGDYNVTNSCGSSVAAGTSCNISVQYHPTSLGAGNGTLSIQTNAAVNGDQSVSLNGAGVDFTITMSRPTRPVRSSANTVIAAKNVPTDVQVSSASPGHTTVTAICSGAPAGTVCEVSPSRFLLEGPTQTLQVRLMRSAISRSLRLRPAASGQMVDVQVTISTGPITRTVSVPVPMP